MWKQPSPNPSSDDFLTVYTQRSAVEGHQIVALGSRAVTFPPDSMTSASGEPRAASCKPSAHPPGVDPCARNRVDGRVVAGERACLHQQLLASAAASVRRVGDQAR